MNICILAEKNKNDHRTPLLPLDIENIKKKNKKLNFYYESSTHRIIEDKHYNAIGCKKYTNQSIDFFLSLKSIKKKFLKRGCAYLFFSEVIQKKPLNIELLKKIIDKQCSLIDLELTKNSKGKNIFLNIEKSTEASKESIVISKKLSTVLPKIIKNIHEDMIEENFIIKKGYLNHRYMHLIDYLI